MVNGMNLFRSENRDTFNNNSFMAPTALFCGLFMAAFMMLLVSPFFGTIMRFSTISNCMRCFLFAGMGIIMMLNMPHPPAAGTEPVPVAC